MQVKEIAESASALNPLFVPKWQSDDLSIALYQADSRSALSYFPESSIDSIVTDPPYELKFMGKSWDGSGIAYSDILWKQAFRVLKPGGHMLAFGGTRTFHRLAVAIEDAGFEIRDCIMWVYGTGFPKSMDIGKAIDKATGVEREVTGRAKGIGSNSGESRYGWNDPADTTDRRYFDTTAPATEAAKQWDGWGTALKPAWEPILLCRKPFNGTVANNVIEHGTGGLNIEASRIETREEGGRPLLEVHALRPEVEYSGNSLEGRVDGSLQSSKAAGSTYKGRFPANLIHDGSDEVLELFPTLGKSRGGQDAKITGWGEGTATGKGTRTAIKGVDPGYGDSGSAARFFYSAKASKSDRGGPSNTHPTVKPQSLTSYLCKLITPPNGIILDPFLGSGTTGVVCPPLGFQFIGIELELSSLQIAIERIQASVDNLQL